MATEITIQPGDKIVVDQWDADFPVKETPSSNDTILGYDSQSGNPISVRMEAISTMLNASFQGNAVESTVPVSDAGNVWYFSGPGTFANFPDENGDPIVLTENLNIISWDGTKATFQGLPIGVDLTGYAEKTDLDAYAKAENVAGIHSSAAVNTNIINPDAAQLGKLANVADGSVITYPTYNTSALLPLQRNEKYTVINRDNPTYGARNVIFYNPNGSKKSYIDGPGLTSFTSPDSDGITAYVTFPSSTNLDAPTAIENCGVFLGEDAPWQPYEFGITTELVNDNTPTSDKTEAAIASIRDVKNLVSAGGMSGDTFEYELNEAGLLKAVYPEGYISGYTRNQRGNLGNNMFNFSLFALVGITGNPVDDVGPTHEQNGPIGGNHGVPIYRLTSAGHGLTNADIGSAWTKGEYTYYLMLVLDANNILMLGQNRGTVEAPSFAPASTGDYTRVSDGTIFSATALNSSQLYPSIKNLESRVLVNGIDEVTVGSGNANYIDIVEYYEIKLIALMLQYVIDNPGGGDLTFPADASTAVNNIYRFLPNMAVVIMTEYRKIRETAFADFMPTQADLMIGEKDNTYFYIPNSDTLSGGLNLQKPTIVPWSSSLPVQFIQNDNQPDPSNPPNRVVSYRDNLAFMIGFLPGRGVSKALNSYTSQTSEIRNNTAKIYLHAVDSVRTNSLLPADATFSVATFRAYSDLSKTREGNRMWVFNFGFERVEYVFIDYSGSKYDKVNLNKDALNGKSIEVVESRNAELLTDTYNGGLTINATYVEGETCYTVLMIS